MLCCAIPHGERQLCSHPDLLLSILGLVRGRKFLPVNVANYTLQKKWETRHDIEHERGTMVRHGRPAENAFESSYTSRPMPDQHRSHNDTRTKAEICGRYPIRREHKTVLS